MCQCTMKAELGEPPPLISKNAPNDYTIRQIFNPAAIILRFTVLLEHVMQLFKIMRKMILGPSLGQLGGIVGSRPWLWITLSLIAGAISFTSIILKTPRGDFGFELGYTSYEAPSIHEMRAQRDFFTGGKEGNPWYSALFAEPRNMSRSMHNGKEYAEMKQFYRKIKNITIRYDEDLDSDITYYDLCGSTCDLNELLFTTVGLSFFGMSYPVTEIFAYKSNIGKHFYDVTTNKDGDLISAKRAMLVFMAFYQTKEIKFDLKLFEEIVQYAVDEHNSDPNSVVHFTLHGERGMAVAVEEGMKEATMYLLYGVALSLVILFFVLLFFSRIFTQSFFRTLLLWNVSVIVPLLSFFTAFAIYNFLGYPITPLTLLTPFLALIHSFYCVIMLAHTWMSDAELRRDSRDEHLLEVFATCMPSLVIITSPAVAFIACSVYPIAHYGEVCFLIGVILAFNLVYAVMFFSPSMILICPAQDFTPLPTSNKEVINPTLKTVENIRDGYCEHVDKSMCVKVAAIVVILTLVVVPGYIGCTTVEGNLDYRQLLKPHSPRNYGVHLMSDIVWPTWFSIMFFVNKPPNFSNPREYGRFKDMLAEIDAIDNKLPAETDMVWINDFCRHTNTKPSDPALNMTRFKSFIEDQIYSSWKEGVKFQFINDTEPVITSMIHIVTFKGTKSLADKAMLFKKCRGVIYKYPEFKTTPFDTEIGFADIILEAPLVIAIIPFGVLSIFLAANVFIIGNLAVAIINYVATLLLYAATVGFVSVCGVSINPFNVSFFFIITALAPSFTTHFCYYYQQAMRINTGAVKRERMNEMLRKCFFPCIASMFCTLAVFFPVVFSQIAIFEAIAFTNFVFCILGITLAFFIQVFLNMLPEMITGTHCLCS